MNKARFAESVSALSAGMEIGARRAPEWFEATLSALEVLGGQRGGIEHPGYRGLSREELLVDLVGPMFPAALSLDRGFALNRMGAVSKEQDVLVVDGNSTGSMMPKSGYYPIEGCLASIQVKSQLTRATIREAIVNCMSIKRLFGWPLVEEEKVQQACDRLCYAVFAYESEWGLKRLAETVNEELADVPREFWPSEFYVLGEGLLLPGDDRGVPIGKETMYTGSTYRGVAGIGAEPALAKSEAYSFLWFLANLIDHCAEQRRGRAAVSHTEYWFTPLKMQLQLNSELQGG